MNDIKRTRKAQCLVSDTRNGTVYRCYKNLGHEETPGDEEHEAQPPEYAYHPPDWRAMFESVRPTLEWAVLNEHLIGPVRAEATKRALIRAYMTRT